MEVAQRIRKMREMRGWTQQYVADRANMNVTLYKQYEYGIRNPKDSQLQKIAEALEVDFSYLRPPKIETNCELLYALREIASRFGDVFIEEEGATIKIKLNDLRVVPTQTTYSLLNIFHSEIVPSSEDNLSLPKSNYTDRELALLYSQTIQELRLVVDSQLESVRNCIARRQYKKADQSLVAMRSLVETLVKQAYRLESEDEGKMRKGV